MDTLPTTTETRSTQIAVPSWVYQILNDKDHERFAITGGLGSGKSANATVAFLLTILSKPTVEQWWDIVPTYPKVEDSLLPTYAFAFERLGMLPGVDYRIVRSKPTVIHLVRTKQHIRCISGDRPELMVSANIGGYIIREAGLMKAEVFENAEARTRDRKVGRTIGIVEGTPEGDGYYKDNFNIDKTDPKRKLRRFILHTADNAANLVDGYVERLHRTFEHNPAKVRSYLYGEFSSFRSGDVFAQFVESRNVIDDIRADPNIPISLCFDFNATPLTWTAWQMQTYRTKVLHRKREIALAESSLKCTDLLGAAIEFGLAFPPEIYGNTPIEIWGDRTGHAKSHKASGTDFSNLQNYLQESYRYVTVKASRKVTPIRASVDVVNRLLLYELVLICESCKNLRRSLNNTRWAQGKDDLEKKQGETHTHHGDGCRYRIWDLYKDADVDDITRGRGITGANVA